MKETGKINRRGIALRSVPWYVLLLPLFFVLHGWKENFYAVDLNALLPLTAVHTGAAVVLLLLCFVLFQGIGTSRTTRIAAIRRAGVLTFSLLAINFFFGAVQDAMLRSALAPVTRYIFILPFILITLIILLVWLKRTKRKLARVTLYLNVLLIAFLVIDVTTIAFLPTKDPARFTVADKSINFKPCSTCPRPDVYFLLCDEFASSASLLETWHYDNSWFDNALRARGFQVMSASSSNYNFTPFSMASILNMEYLHGVGPQGNVSMDDYQRCNALIKHNSLLSFFRANDYEIRNYSIFDLDGHPSFVQQSFLPLNTRTITEQTFLNRLKRDLGHLLVLGRFRVGFLSKLALDKQDYDSPALLSRVVSEAGSTGTTPRFFYVHLLMPHVPIWYDSLGNRRSDSLVALDYRQRTLPAYLGSVSYTSKRLIGAVDSILHRSANPPIIVLMGDHGFRLEEPSTGRKDFFRNMNAVYLPSVKQPVFPDSMTTVNEFRILLNTAFGQQLPMLADSTTLLIDKQW